MDPQKQKEEFSNAFVQAAAAVAGFAVSKPSVDDDSVDWCLHDTGGRGTFRSPRLELQLKCTGAAQMGEHHVKFPLGIKNYDDLIPTDVMVPRILVVVAVPAVIHDWHVLGEDGLLLRSCAYWRSLRGEPPSDNEYTVTVDIPRRQRFDAAALSQIMDRIRTSGLP